MARTKPCARKLVRTQTGYKYLPTKAVHNNNALLFPGIRVKKVFKKRDSAFICDFQLLVLFINSIHFIY